MGFLWGYMAFMNVGIGIVALKPDLNLHRVE